MGEINEEARYDGVPVQCSGCGGIFHELTEKYVYGGMLRGSHFRLNSYYRGIGWYDFAHEDWVIGDNVVCPQCMRPYGKSEVEACAKDQRGALHVGEVGTFEADDSVEQQVRRMTWDGVTQAEIAEICSISVYRVRQIQNGERV